MRASASTASIWPPRPSTASRRSSSAWSARSCAPSTLAPTVRDGAISAWTYFTNHRHSMDYPGFLAAGLPIGSGVTEAACKTLVRQRLCASGMRWKSTGAGIVLSLRALTQTPGRWEPFWRKIDQFGAACCG